jgi:hypothetical protein
VLIFESILLILAVKIVLQHNHPESRHCSAPSACPLSCLGRAKTPAPVAHVEAPRRNCASRSRKMLRARHSIPRWRIVFSTFPRCMSFHTANANSRHWACLLDHLVVNRHIALQSSIASPVSARERFNSSLAASYSTKSRRHLSAADRRSGRTSSSAPRAA